MGAVREVGNLRLWVPEGYTYVAQTNMGEPDDNQIWLQTVPPGFADYYWIIVKENESEVDLSIAMTKEVNGGEEIEAFSVGSGEWSGVTYLYESGFEPALTCNVLKGHIAGRFYQVTIIGHEVVSKEVQQVLGSIEYFKRGE